MNPTSNAFVNIKQIYKIHNKTQIQINLEQMDTF